MSLDGQSAAYLNSWHELADRCLFAYKIITKRRMQDKYKAGRYTKASFAEILLFFDLSNQSQTRVHSNTCLLLMVKWEFN